MWFRFWHWFYSMRPCKSCYPDSVRVCERFEPSHRVISVNARTGEQHSYIAPDRGCVHRHHDYEIWFA